MKHFLLLLTALLLGSVMSVQGQEKPAGSDTIVSFVTVYPGSEIYELEGHSALRVTIPGSVDLAVNFGLFDFNTPNFVYRFVKGETDYMVGAYPWSLFVASYAGSGRRIVEQELRLDGAGKARLIEELSGQLTPPNNTYRYNYVLDNCATRPLSLVALAAGQDSLNLSEPTPERLGAQTFREVMRYYHRNYPWYQFGIDLALGPLIDRPITRLEQTFAPVSLMEALDGSGLAEEAKTVTSGPEDGAAAGRTPWILTPMAAGLLILLLSLVVTVYDLRTRSLSKGFDAAFFGILGLTGCVTAFLVFVSEHYATTPNYLIFWLNPLCLIPTIFLWSRAGRRIVFVYQALYFLVLAGLVVLWPLNAQSANPAIWPMIGATLLRSASYVVNCRKSQK